jgi:signal transduction histidine kinase
MASLASLSRSEGEQRREELQRQYRILRSEFVPRILLVAFGYAICSIYVSPILLAALFLVELVGEFISQGLLRGLDPTRSPVRYRAFLLSLVPMEASLVTAAGLLWMHDDPYAKAIAIAITMTALLHLCSVRSIHLALGMIGMATVATVALVFNTLHWVGLGNWTGLAVSTVTALVGLGYAAIAMVSNNRLHRTGDEAAATARAANEAKGRFLAQISHELRTPLNAVIGLSEIEAAAATGASRKRLRTVVTSARDLAVMLDDAVDYSAITEGRVTVTPRPVSVPAELLGNLLAFELQARKQGRDLVVTVDANMPDVLMIDGQRVRQCLGNMIGNALKHTSHGPVAVQVRHAKGRLVIDVADEGPGIPQESHEKVFEPFYRGSSGTPGVGLGLAISRAVARQMAGDLVVVPSVRGATFRLTVQAPEAEAATERKGAADFRNTTILVVDDISTNRMVAAQLLVATGARVIEASGGPEALARLAQGGIDAVLLDLMMPDMDGRETLRRIRAAHGRSVPVVAMTADVLSIHGEDGLSSALDGFLPKPILPETLRDVLGSVLTRG